MKNKVFLTIVIPTVQGRETWLSQLLHSIESLSQNTDIEILVSGNATGQSTEDLSKKFSTQFYYRNQKLTADRHHRKLIEEISDGYVWFIGDDDFIKPEVILKVVEILKKSGPDILIGKATFFEKDPALDSWPTGDTFIEGEYISISDVAQATGSMLRFGTFVFNRSSVSLVDYDYFADTSHQIFGMIWRAIFRKNLRTLVLNSEIIFLRQSTKEWDLPPLRIMLGGMKYVELLPEEVARNVKTKKKVIKLREFVELIYTTQHVDYTYLVEYFSKFRLGVIPFIAFKLLPFKFLKFVFQKLKNQRSKIRRDEVYGERPQDFL